MSDHDPQDWQLEPRDPDASAKLYDRLEDEREYELEQRDRLEERL